MSTFNLDRPNPTKDFRRAMLVLLDEHRPSRMPFFRRVASLPFRIAGDPDFLGEIYLVYQAAMHATRAAVYYLPYLDSPALRRRKLRILMDDDRLPGDDSHHYQLARAFRNIGAHLPLADEEFGSHEDLCRHLDQETAHFVHMAQRLYCRSLGPWCALEMLSADWMRALAEALSVHFPGFIHESYFEDCFSQRVEERHAEEAMAVTQMVLQQRPELLDQTIRDAKMMTQALDGVWNNFPLHCAASSPAHEWYRAPRGSPHRRPNGGGNPNESDRSTRLIRQSPAADLAAAFSGDPLREPISSGNSAMPGRI